MLAAIVVVLCTISCGNAPTAENQGVEIEIPAATALWVQVDKTLDGAKAKVNDPFKGSLAETIVQGGRDVVPQGTTVRGRITNVQTAQGAGSAGLLTLALDSIELRGHTYEVKTSPQTFQAPPLTAPLDAGAVPQAPGAEDARKNAVVPKNEMVAFTLDAPLRIK